MILLNYAWANIKIIHQILLIYLGVICLFVVPSNFIANLFILWQLRFVGFEFLKWLTWIEELRFSFIFQLDVRMWRRNKIDWLTLQGQHTSCIGMMNVLTCSKWCLHLSLLERLYIRKWNATWTEVAPVSVETLKWTPLCIDLIYLRVKHLAHIFFAIHQLMLL